LSNINFKIIPNSKNLNKNFFQNYTEKIKSKRLK